MIKSVIFCALVAVSLAAPQIGKLTRVAVADPRLAAILRLDSEILPDGRYHYAYETENGISAEESGEPKPVGNFVGTAAQGFYKYTSPEGVPVEINYIADENGYQPTGNVLPTSPPVPEAILRSIEYIATHQQPVSGARTFSRRRR